MDINDLELCICEQLIAPVMITAEPKRVSVVIIALLLLSFLLIVIRSLVLISFGLIALEIVSVQN